MLMLAPTLAFSTSTELRPARVGASFGDMKTTSQAVHIGSGTGKEGFVGQIDDTRIYSVAIGPDIVQAIYDLEKA
jgi:hypothetical protein